MKQVTIVAVVLVALVLLILVGGTFYIVNETQQAIITQFGKPVGDPVTAPGLKLKLPFIQKVKFFEKRFMEWDGERNQLPTRDKRFIWVDTYARWRVTDPLQFFLRLRDERSAQSRLDDILDGETRNTIARHNLIEAVRGSDRQFVIVEELEDDQVQQSQLKIELGRARLEAEVLAAAAGRVSDLGIEILDFRFKRINYVPEVRAEVYQRMITERNRIAERYRSEGMGESARINGEKQRELQQITSEAYKTAQEIKGKADAEAADIYARAYNGDPEFYRFLKSMDVLKATMDKETVLLLGTDGELLRYLEVSK